MGVHGDPVAADDQQHKQQNHDHCADKSQFFADNAEDEVGLSNRDKVQFLLGTVEEPFS